MRDDKRAAGLGETLSHDRDAARRSTWTPPNGPESRPRVPPKVIALACGLTALLVIAGAAVAVIVYAPRGQSGTTAAAAPASPTAPTDAPGDASSPSVAPGGGASPSPSPTPADGAPAISGLLAVASRTAAPPGTPGSTPDATPTPTPAPTRAPLRFSFENGGTDGWTGTGHVTSVTNGTTAHAGTRSLHVTLFSSGGSDLPYVSVGVSGSSAPAAGQTVSVFAFVPSSSAAAVQANVFVQDTRSVWHQGSLVRLPSGRWTELRLSVPAGTAVDRLGVQFLATPFNSRGTVYLDAIGWE